MSLRKRLQRMANELDALLENAPEEQQVKLFSDIDIKVVYAIQAFDVDGAELDLLADENKALQRTVSRGITSMSQRSGQNSLTESFTSSLLHSINTNIHRSSDAAYREDSLERRTKSIVDVDWLDDGTASLNFHTTVNSVLMGEDEAKQFGAAVRTGIGSYRGKGASIIKHAVEDMYGREATGNNLPEGVTFKVRYVNTEVINLSTEYGDSVTARRRRRSRRTAAGTVKAAIRYTDDQAALVEEILSDHVNEGCSEKEGDTTLFVVDIPKEKVDELLAAGVKASVMTSGAN